MSIKQGCKLGRDFVVDLLIVPVPKGPKFVSLSPSREAWRYSHSYHEVEAGFGTSCFLVSSAALCSCTSPVADVVNVPSLRPG
jgi:hypothetical protein